MSIERQIPNFISASSPMSLRRLMIMNNAKHRMFFKYFDIQFVKGKWVAWYFMELENNDPVFKEEAK